VAGAGQGYVNRYEIKKDTCVGCNLCSLVCPVNACISMQEMDSGLPSMNWSEYQDKLSKGEVSPILPPGHV
jgi:MinD superfamily P-loop ATPase